MKIIAHNRKELRLIWCTFIPSSSLKCQVPSAPSLFWGINLRENMVMSLVKMGIGGGQVRVCYAYFGVNNLYHIYCKQCHI